MLMTDWLQRSLLPNLCRRSVSLDAVAITALRLAYFCLEVEETHDRASTEGLEAGKDAGWLIMPLVEMPEALRTAESQ